MAKHAKSVNPPPVRAPAGESPGDVEHDSSFCVVGIGASAGGLEAFRQLLAVLPADTGLGFVIVQHLAPTHVSSLAEILSRSTSMPVTEVQDEPHVKSNHIYVIPPGKTMVIAGRNLKLRPREERGQHHPIDLFFQSLAQDQGHTSMGIVLSGTGNDGTAGLQEIKAAGGITFAQDDSAQQDGMPHSAIATGCVDFVLSPQRIAEEIARIAHHAYLAAPAAKSDIPVAEEPGLERIQRQLHRTTAVDFSHYKPNTIHRRITRRMLLLRLENIDDYARLLEDRPDEVEALFQDILIGVTGFFRNPATFDALARDVFPSLLNNGRSRNDPLRIWVLGCSSGEEAYSYAMVAAEAAPVSSGGVPVQIFATDLNPASVAKARAGIYPKSIAQDVSETRLRRFFSEVDDGNYRISKAIRDTCVFAHHNVLRDPPFSRLDLISCRNLLIYLDTVLQKRLLTHLHYALKPGAYLVLGNSEAISAYRNLFEAQDPKHKIYRKRGGLPLLTATVPRIEDTGHVAIVPLAKAKETANLPLSDPQKDADRILLAKYAPSAVVISDDLQILQFRGDTSPYLKLAPGKASLSLLKMAREGLLVVLRAAILEAKKQRAPVREAGLRMKIDGVFHRVNLEVIPVGSTAAGGGFLILFEDSEAKRPRAKPAPSKSKSRKSSPSAAEKKWAEEDSVRLTQELAATREYLQSMIEQQEVVNEELQSANEEAQSANEELQSINEELETSKEEIQSSNEELVTINDELENRNREVNQVNNDLVNLLGSIDTAIVMVGHDLRLRRYTPLAEKVFNLVPADVGRPLTDIKLKLEVPNLDLLLVEAIDSVSVKEVEVQDARGHWYLLRLRPYKTPENVIDGAVLVLIDIDKIKRAREFAENVVNTVREPLLVLDQALRIRSASRAFYKTFRLSAQESQNRFLYELADGEWNIPALRKALVEALSINRGFEDLEVAHRFTSVGPQVLLVNARRLVHEPDSDPLILMSIEIVTERKRLHDSMREVAQLSEADRSKNEFLAMLAHELRNPLAPLQNSLHVLKNAAADDATRAHLHGVMDRQIKLMTRLVDDLLDAARVTQGKIGTVMARVELDALLDRVAQSVQPQIEGRSQTLSLSLLPEPVYVNADAMRLEQAFGNLLHNASKFSPPHSQISLAVELAHPHGIDAAHEAIVRIHDHGIGISPDMLPHVFELFMQSDRSLDRKLGGLGVGLTLTKELLELHGGSIEAHSEGLGQGSEFVVRLPLLPLQSAETRSSDTSGQSKAATKRDILVVDDNVDAAESFAAVLRLGGHQVHTAFTAANALQMAAQARPDVIVLDIGLPEMDGYELARRLRAQPHLEKTLLIALTGYGQEEDRQRALAAGFDYHFTKPVEFQMLDEVLETLLPPA